MAVWRLNSAISNTVDIPAVTHFYTIDALLSGDPGAFGDVIWHLVLPAITLSTITMAIVSRMARSSMLEVLSSDYLTTARAKGLRERGVVLREADPEGREWNAERRRIEDQRILFLLVNDLHVRFGHDGHHRFFDRTEPIHDVRQ